MQICIFEPDVCENLEPLVFYRPVYDLVCGYISLKEKILRAYPGCKYSLQSRDYLVSVLKYRFPDVEINEISDDACLFINGSAIAPPSMSKIIPLKGSEDKIYVNGENIIAARVSGRRLTQLKKKLNKPISKKTFQDLPTGRQAFPVESVDIKSANYIWDLINNNEEQMRVDFKTLTKGKRNRIKGKINKGVQIIGKENIYIEEGAEIKPGVVIDATKAPVYIDRKAVIFPNSVIEGSLYLGEMAQLKSCTVVHGNLSIGKVCKVGGEVGDSIFMPYSNKQHAGFIGHSYIGSWVNIGADTNCSDLKNNYGNVKAYVNGEMVDSGCQFLGVIIGDHTKVAINTMFNTGTVAGFSCNVFGAGFPDKYLPSFSWAGENGLATYDLERSVETAGIMMQRRNVQLDDSEKKLFRKIFELTQKERKKRGYPY